MIGVMASAVFPGRIGEPTRVVVLTRRLEGRNRHLLPIVAGTVFSQTLINLLALVILASVAFTSVPLLQRPRDGDRHGDRDSAGLVRARAARSTIARARPALALRAPGARRGHRRPRAAPGTAGTGRVHAPAQRDGRRRQPAGRLGASVAGLLHGAALSAPAVRRRPRGRRGDPPGGQRQRDPARDALERGGLPGGLPGRAGGLRRRGRAPDSPTASSCRPSRCSQRSRSAFPPCSART